MQTNFQSCLAFTLAAEGGFTDNPSDPGGATMAGVTLATYRAWKNDQSLAPSDLRLIASADLAAIYEQMYWATNSCDDLPAGVDLMTFDMDVNAGDMRSAKLLQSAVGTPIDGAIGPETLKAANSIYAVTLINSLADLQTAFYQSLSTFGIFGKGWLKRVEARQHAALAMVQATLAISPLPIPIRPLTPADNPPEGFWDA